jgi:microsomal triglyceride transfer protein large subunit
MRNPKSNRSKSKKYDRNYENCHLKKYFYYFLFSAGLALEGSIAVESSYVSLSSKVIITQEPKLHLSSDLDFYTDNVLCMKLVQPDVTYKQEIVNSQRIPGTKAKGLFRHNVSYHIPGYTHFLNQKNNDMCNRISES